MVPFSKASIEPNTVGWSVIGTSPSDDSRIVSADLSDTPLAFAMRTLVRFPRADSATGVLPVSSQAKSTDFVQSLERGLAVITSFSSDARSLTLSEVADRTGLTRAASRRFLLTLKDLGYVESDGRQFTLRPRVLELGYSYLSSLPVWEIARPHLEELAEKVQETTSASVLDGDVIVFVERVTLAPLNDRTVTKETKLRRIIAEARESGWTLVDQEVEEGVRSLAVPIRSPDGRVEAAITVCSHALRVPPERVREEFLPLVLETSERVTADLGRR